MMPAQETNRIRGGNALEWIAIREGWAERIAVYGEAWEKARAQGHKDAYRFWMLWAAESWAWRQIYDPYYPVRVVH